MNWYDYFEDLVEGLTGEWVYDFLGNPHCSECGYKPFEISPYCPSCGACMEP